QRHAAPVPPADRGPAAPARCAHPRVAGGAPRGERLRGPPPRDPLPAADRRRGPGPPPRATPRRLSACSARQHGTGAGQPNCRVADVLRLNGVVLTSTHTGRAGAPTAVPGRPRPARAGGTP